MRTSSLGLPPVSAALGGASGRETSPCALCLRHIHPPPQPPAFPWTILLSSSHPCSAEAGPDFELRLELYGACVEEEGALAGAPKRLATKLSSSLGRSSGRRVRASLEMAGGSGSSPILLPTPAVG